MARRAKATAIRSLIMKCTRTIRQSSAILNGGWGTSVNVGLAVREGYTLPENSPAHLRSAYHNLLALELVAREAKNRLTDLVREIHGDDVVLYMTGKTDYRDVPTINQEV